MFSKSVSKYAAPSAAAEMISPMALDLPSYVRSILRLLKCSSGSPGDPSSSWEWLQRLGPSHLTPHLPKQVSFFWWLSQKMRKLFFPWSQYLIMSLWFWLDHVPISESIPMTRETGYLVGLSQSQTSLGINWTKTSGLLGESKTGVDTRETTNKCLL